MTKPLPYNLLWAREDLDSSLSKLDIKGVRHGLEQVLTQLSLGVDVSPLLGSVVMASEAHDIPCKRMVYTIMTSIARNDPDTTILITNTLMKDCSSENPIVRGMALRAICDIPITTMVDELPKIVTICLSDTNPYVRRMAVLASVHLHEVQPSSIEEKGIVNRLYELLRDRDPQIICNSLLALAEILKNDGGVLFDMKLIHHLVNSLPQFSEWAQSEVLTVISKYVPESDKERFDIMNIVDPYLTSSSATVMISTTKVLLNLTNNRLNLQSQVVQRVIPKFITHCSAATPEVQYTIYSHLIVLARRFPAVFRPHIPHFYVSFTDSFYIAQCKFSLLKLITDDAYTAPVVETTSRYILLEKPQTVSAGISLLRDLALNLPNSVKLIINKIRTFFDMKREHIINECLIILPDLMRRLPNYLVDFVSLLPTEPPQYLTGDALSSYAWILGEFGERVPNSVYFIEHTMLKFWDKGGPSLKLSLITSLAKMLFISPAEARPVLAAALAMGQRDSHPEVKARAVFVFNLLKYDLQAARAAFMTIKTNNEKFIEDAESETIDMVFDEFNTFSVIFDKPESEWNMKPDDINLEIEEDEPEEDENNHKADEITEEMTVSPEMFEELWGQEEIATDEDELQLGYELELDSFVEALQEANIGVIASGNTDEEGNKIFAYGYIDGAVSFIQCIEKGGLMKFTIKSENHDNCITFKDFWLEFFNE